MYKEAPWSLKGDGYILLYKFKKSFIKNHIFSQDFLKDCHCGGLGCVMIVDYKESDVGPYRELLFIPGKFKFNGKKLNTISKIYVTTQESVVNGIRNWAIPKEIADCNIKQNGNVSQVEFSKGEERILKITFKDGKIKFPVNTKLLPFPLVQKQEDKLYYTNFYGSGKGSFARIEQIEINEKYFPNIQYYKPIAVVKVTDFNIVFPKAEIEGMKL
ncbi:acetoacetate decarboxylase family protein [Caloramator proteoclasticus]|uniref:Acetoacetate decarboxylase (ADC) n=1 Tax=Caloramator proteoclasticus DSM 10124 TaxID=1121262 RepID=A0A1M4T096_9CLOT|nr:acetoacetate decarboxylase family protein [Caloramator proteoclasticus]SHE37874.1 Acetoacetate decarboxylase (ADC) [Caloramator proteoclasticus DSM 10124]